MLRSMDSSLMDIISSCESPGSMRTNLSERYSLSTCCFIRKLLPLKVRATSNTTSASIKPRSCGDTFTSSRDTQSPLK